MISAILNIQIVVVTIMKNHQIVFVLCPLLVTAWIIKAINRIIIMDVVQAKFHSKYVLHLVKEHFHEIFVWNNNCFFIKITIAVSDVKSS